MWAADRGPGRKLPMQTGIAAIAAAVVDNLGSAPEARAWASAPSRGYAVLTYPVVIDLEATTVVQPRNIVVGRIFVPFLRALVDDVLAEPLSLA